MKIRQFILTHWPFFFALCIFVVLLARNPFSERTLISNLEPYPDSIHYINPALSFLRGHGLLISREGRSFLPSVPPFYSVALLSVYLFTTNVPAFYFLNVGLALLAFVFFYLITAKLFPDRKGLQFFLVFLYVTNYIFYWFPELAMAENLLLPLILAAVYLLLLPPTRKIAVMIAVLSVSFYATKFSSLSLSIAVPILFFWKTLQMKKAKEKEAVASWFLLALGISGGLYLIYEYLARGDNLILSLFSLLFSVFAPQKIASATQGSGEGGYFSVEYIANNLPRYLSWLVGTKLGVLPKQLAILPRFLALPALAGLLLSLTTNKRWISSIWLTMLGLTLFLMMIFYAVDGRYFIVAVPAMIIGVGLFLDWIARGWPKKGPFLSRLLLLLFFAGYLMTQATRLKFDVMLNLKYAENPWYSISIKTFDNYLAEHRSEFTKTPVIISAVPPYLIDLYAHQPMLVLPLSPSQEFRSQKQAAWGDHNYDDLPAEFRKYFEAGYPVFLTQYGLGDEQKLHQDFDALFDQFIFTKVVDGCYSVCNVYQLTGIR